MPEFDPTPFFVFLVALAFTPVVHMVRVGIRLILSRRQDRKLGA